MEFEIHRRRGGGPAWFVFAPGVACILFGILILLMPEILVALVAGAFLVVGAALLSVAWRVRNAGRGGFSMFGDRSSR